MKWQNKKSHGSRLKANVEGNAIIMCFKLGLNQTIQKKIFIWLPYQIFSVLRYNSAHKVYTANTLHNMKGPVYIPTNEVTKQNKHMVCIWKEMLRRIQFKYVHI